MRQGIHSWGSKKLSILRQKTHHACERHCTALMLASCLMAASSTSTSTASSKQFCGFIVNRKPILTYATFGCKTSAGCFQPGSTLQLMATSGINPNMYHQESNWGSVDNWIAQLGRRRLPKASPLAGSVHASFISQGLCSVHECQLARIPMVC